MYQAPWYSSCKRSLLLTHSLLRFKTQNMRAHIMQLYHVQVLLLFDSLKLLMSPFVPMLKTKFGVALSVSLEISSAQDSTSQIQN